MQSAYLKIVATSIVLIITTFNTCFAQTSSFRLRTADSLYNAKLYTQSYEHYEEIFRQHQYTPAMLLKMAYIQEGLNNIGNAMYFLNLYFDVTNDKAAQAKMEELAERFNLEGYETNDTVRFLTFYNDYYDSISLTLSALTVLFLSMVFYTRVRLQRRPVVTGIFFLVFTAALFVHVNFAGKSPLGIISGQPAYIMDGPSAGADLVVVTGGGHRVTILGKKDVWLRILWNGDVAYVRQHSVLPVQL